jgi:hypothetical protein
VFIAEFLPIFRGKGGLYRYEWQRVGSVAQIEYAYARLLPSG